MTRRRPSRSAPSCCPCGAAGFQLDMRYNKRREPSYPGLARGSHLGLFFRTTVLVRGDSFPRRVPSGVHRGPHYLRDSTDCDEREEEGIRHSPLPGSESHGGHLRRAVPVLVAGCLRCPWVPACIWGYRLLGCPIDPRADRSRYGIHVHRLGLPLLFAGGARNRIDERAGSPFQAYRSSLSDNLSPRS